MKRRIFIKTILLLLPLFFAAGASAENKIKVACVGDSITAGSGIKNQQMDSYPAILAEMLGKAYDVRNFGASGRTLLKKGDNPYANDSNFKKALEFNPNIVIIKLGTNDSKPQNWKHKEEFKGDMLEMIAAFQALESKPEVILCTPMLVVKSAWGITEDVVKTEVIPLIKEIAAEKNLRLIDFHTAFANNAEMIPDGVHPNEAGALKMAEIAYKILTGKDAPALAEPRGKFSEIEDWKRLDFPYQRRDIVVVFPKNQNENKNWVWLVDNFSSLSERNKQALNDGKTLVWADASIWWGGQPSMRWAFEFHTYMREKLNLANAAEMEACGIGAMFALYWTDNSTDKIASLYFENPICDIAKFPDRNNEKQLNEFLKKWRISKEDLENPKTNIFNDLSKIAKAGIKITISPNARGNDAEALEAAIKKAN